MAEKRELSDVRPICGTHPFSLACHNRIHNIVREDNPSIIMQPPGSKQLLHTSTWSSTILSRLGKTVAVTLLLVLACTTLLYLTHRGFRRSVHFWCHMSPIIAEYKILQAHSRWIVVGGDEEEAYQKRIYQFHQRTAPKLVKLILKMGGIYVKIGQFMSTVGGGLIDDTYLAALAPLQDGIPPRPIHQMANIIETSTGKTMEELFDYFESVPIGAASIAQAHRARLWDGTEVVVKVQYPEVAELYQADFMNLKMVTRLLAPEQLPTVQTLRERHENELDFRQEAAHLQEVSENMQRHGLQPKLIRIPRVIGNATQHVLCMEYMEGISLKEAMHNELEDIAVAMGYSDAASLRKTIQDNLRQHFLEGGGELTENANGVLLAATRVAPLVRIYAGWNRKVVNARTSLRNGASRALRVASRGKIDPDLVELRRYIKIDLGKVIKLLVMVHGVQVVLDGVYNADPHPGNVIIMSDGRVALIDYGMVGRLTKEQRELIASTVLAFAEKDKKTVVRNYLDSGYRAGWIHGGNHSDDIIYRFASFHLDRIDLSPVTVDGVDMDILKLLGKSIERATPDWIQQMRRIGGLLIGVSSQAGRPISLSQEWRSIARQSMKEKSKGQA